MAILIKWYYILYVAQTPTMDAAVIALRDRITSGSFGPSGILPSIQTLARQLGVSLVTAWKAAQALKREGLLIGRRGRPLMVAPNPFATEKQAVPASLEEYPQPKLKHRHLEAWMKRDLLSGVYRPGQQLPSIKELQRRYGVSYPTLRKTLAALAEDDLVQPHGAGFRVTPLTLESTRRNRVILVTRAHALGRVFSGVLFAEFLRRMEENCRAAQVRLDILSYESNGETAEYARWPSGERVALREQDDLLGYVFAPESLGDEHETVARDLSILRVPLAIVDDAGMWDYPAWLVKHPQVRFFRVGLAEQPARAVARFLLGLGHRRAAFFSPFHLLAWSQTRCAGLNAAFAEAGIVGGIVPIVINASSTEFMDATSRAPAVVTLEKLYRRWQKSAPAAYVKQFEAFMGRVFTIESAHGRIRTRMAPLFEQAAADRSITAWIGANDLIAGFACDFCKDRRIAVPRDVSIVGFDDSMDSLNNDITSYNLNLQAIADAALSHLLQRRNPLLTGLRKIIDIEGALAVRGSAAPPQRKGDPVTDQGR